MKHLRRTVPLGFALALITVVAPRAEDTPPRLGQDSDRASVAMMLFSESALTRRLGRAWIAEHGKTDLVAPLITALRYNAVDRTDIAGLLKTITGADLGTQWADWMRWQQDHPEIKPFAGYDRFKADQFAEIDPGYRVFLYPGVDHEIRLEEIVWGGVAARTGIPALTNPKLIPPVRAGYLADDDLVFGLAINGDARAYPLRILNWHEMLNDVVGGVPVSLAYCTLCASGILFDTSVEGYDAPFVFGSSGLLYRSNKLMHDTKTHSLWNQFTGRPVVGKLTGSGIRLKLRPVVITTWKAWYRRNPSTKVLSVETGHVRDYRPGAAYGAYFSSPDLMFRVSTPDMRLKPKDYVFGLRTADGAKAWPLALFAGGRVINDRIGRVDVVLIGDAATRSVRAYRSAGQKFRSGSGSNHLTAGGIVWRIAEDALIGADGRRLPRLPGHVAYWFAWRGYFANSAVAGEPSRAP